jgi:hypothetical protein
MACWVLSSLISGKAEKAYSLLASNNQSLPNVYLSTSLNSVDEGVWLPNMSGVGEGAYHPGLHTGEYYDEVERRLKTVTSRERVLEILQDIKEELSRNRFFY